MVARAFIAKRFFDQNKIGRVAKREELSGRGDAEEQLAAGGEKFLGHQHREGGSHRTAEHTELEPLLFEKVEIGVIAGPVGAFDCTIFSQQMPHDVAVRVQQADLGHGAVWG